MPVQFKIFPQAEAIDRDTWNYLAASAGPTMEWEYFYSLEKSGAVSMERGYEPRHVMVIDDGRPVGLVPLYERDRAWVEFGDGGLIEFLTEVTGLPFHHGLVGTIPFTPVPGYQFLTSPGMDPVKYGKALLDYIDFMCHTRGLSTSRFYFLAPEASHMHHLLMEQGYMSLRSQYCLWVNKEYRDFDDFLGAFRSNRRTKIKRELRTIRDDGISIEMVRAADVPSTYYTDMFRLYVNTWRKHMGTDIRPFLNESFFTHLSREFRHRNSFSIARRSSGEIVGMALFYSKNDRLYGRYWGCFEEVPFLHFATCYYHPIEFSIREGIRSMDPGFGGEHKLYRGFEIIPAYHYIKFHGRQERRLANAILERMQMRGIVEEDKN